MIKQDYDKIVSAGLKVEIEKHKIPFEFLCTIAEMPLSTFNDKLSNKTPWRVKEVALFAEYFGVSLDKLIIGISFSERKKLSEIEVKAQIKKFLVENRKYKTLGKLEADGYFKILNN